jgi:endogenous inhibitor of DNA gyrase (YacG/DUF329 family)
MAKAKAKPTERETYDSVTPPPNNAPEAGGRALLGLLLRSRGKLLEIDPEIGDMANDCLRYIEQLEELVEELIAEQGEEGRRRYRSILPLQAKKKVKWKQPKHRKHPVYEFEIDCPYCQQSVKLERLSPHYPAHCDKESCKRDHKRALARERKRRQRDKKQ